MTEKKVLPPRQSSSIMGLIEVTKSDLNDQQFEQGLQLIKSYIDIFSRSDDDVGHTDIVQHSLYRYWL
jgi:hypothetical protein